MKSTANSRTAPLSTSFAKQASLKHAPTRLFVVVAVVLLSAFAIHRFIWRSPRPADSPQAIAISTCPGVPSGAHRITSDFGIRFDVPEKAFIVHTGLRDMPPGTLYVVKLKDAEAKMVVWRDDDVFRDLKTAYPIFSERVEARNLRDTTGRIFGTDRWGYLESGERWRYVRFSTGDVVGYEPTPQQQANLLDQLLSSACLLRDENLRE